MTDLVNGKIEEQKDVDSLKMLNLIILCGFFLCALNPEKHKFCWSIRTLEKNYTGNLLLWLAE